MRYLIRGLAALGFAVGIGFVALVNDGTKINALESPLEIVLKDISRANEQYKGALRYFDNAHKFARDSPMQTRNLNNSREMIADSFGYLQNARAELLNHQRAEGLPAVDGCEGMNDESLIRAKYELNLRLGEVYALKGDIEALYLRGVKEWKKSTYYLEMTMGCGPTEEEKNAIGRSIDVNENNINMSLDKRLEKSLGSENI